MNKKVYLLFPGILIVIIVIAFTIVNKTTYPWNDNDPETPWNIERIFNGHYPVNMTSNKKINVAILDTFLDLNHPDLDGQITWTKDVRTKYDPHVRLIDSTMHGTLLAGIVAGLRNNIGIVGVNPNVNLYSIVTANALAEGQGESSWIWIVDGIYAAVDGPDEIPNTNDDADIISMSFRVNETGTTTIKHLTEFHDAIQYAYNHGVVLVAGVGNDAIREYSTDYHIWPAEFDEVIGVGGTCEDDSLASFSNVGPYVEVVAPGCSIKSTYSDSYTTDFEKKFFKTYCNIENEYAACSGTSFSVPHVAGVISLLMEKYPDLPIGNKDDTDNSTLRGLLHTMAYDLGTPGYDQSFGFGLIQYSDMT